MGTVTTTPCIAVSNDINSDGIFGLTPSASAPDVVKDKEYMFQMCFTDPNQGVASAKYIKEQNLGQKIAVIYNNSDVYSTGIYQKFVLRLRHNVLKLFVQRHLRMTRQTTLLHSSTKSRLRAQTSFSCRFTTHRHRLSSHRQRRCSMSRSSSVLTVWTVS